MERKANRFVHKLADKLLRENWHENISEAPAMKHHFTKAVEAMKVGKLKQELLTHMPLYAKKFCHIMLTNFRKRGMGASSPQLQETEPHPEAPHPVAPHPSTLPDRNHVEEAPELSSNLDRVGFAFNLYARDGEVTFSSLHSKKDSDLLSSLCVPSGHEAFQLISSNYFSGEKSYQNLKQATQVLIGQKQPEITLRYLSAVVKNISKEVETVVTQEDKKGCEDLLTFINKLLMLSRFRSTMTKMSFPENITPSIDDLLAALLSMSVDLGAIISRSVEDLPKYAKQTTLQVLLHLDHSPSHQLDVLLQLTSSSKDAAFLEPLYRRILCCHLPMPSNATFIKFVCAVRQAKKILHSTIPEVVSALVQEACLQSPTNLAVWLQEGSAQWLNNVKKKSKKNGNAEIVKYLIDTASEVEVGDLLEFLMASEEAVQAEEEEDLGDLFFVDKSKDDIEGILPEGSEIFERDNEDDEDSDLEEQINLADELLAELDRGLLKGNDAEENEGGSVDEMENETGDKKDDEEDVPVNEEEKMELSKVSPPEGVENDGRVSPIFNFLPGQEISFEEKRAQDLNLLQPRKVTMSPKKRKLSDKSQNNQDGIDTSGVDEAGLDNRRVVETEEQSLGTAKRNSRRRRGKSNFTSKDVRLSSSPSIKDGSVLENGDDLNLGQGVKEGERGKIKESDLGESLQKSQEQGTQSVIGQEDEGVTELQDKMHDVVPSSEIDERDSSQHHHERLSFPMLSEQERKDSPNRRRKVRKRKSGENGQRNLFRTPKVVANAENRISAASDHDDEDDNAGQKEEENCEKEGEGVEHQVSKFLKEIRYKTRNAVRSPEPRRSSRIRQASTSSTEGGQVATKRKEFGKMKMSLRMRTSSQK